MYCLFLVQPHLLRASNQRQSVVLGNTTRLFCDYDGNPKPEVYWYHINPISDVVRQRSAESQNSNELYIRNVTYNDEGKAESCFHKEPA